MPLWRLLHTAGRHGAFDVAAQLAYWALLALFPFSIFVLTVVGYLPIHDDGILRAVYAVMPVDAGRVVAETLREVVGVKRAWLLALSLAGALWPASGGVSALMTALNRAFEVEETRPFWKIRGEALVMTLVGMILSVIAVGALLLGPRVAHWLVSFVGLGEAFDRAWRWIRWPVVTGAWMVLLALVYWVLPNRKSKLRLITPGSVIAVVLWVGASAAFNAYVSHFHSYARTYGALGGAVILLTWLYLSGLMVILGGEINAALKIGHPAE